MPVKRSLLKFSHYSTSLVLPKRMVAELGWQPGDVVTVTFESHKKQLLIQGLSTTNQQKHTPAPLAIPAPAPVAEQQLSTVAAAGIANGAIGCFCWCVLDKP